jgi:hypothetical protein
MSPQDKLMVVANRLGLSSLKDMQGSTGAIYDCDLEGNGTIFTSAKSHVAPDYTNLNQNKFEVNEALLIETIGWYSNPRETAGPPQLENLDGVLADDIVILYDVVIGNKRVIKEQPVFVAGAPYTFANSAGVNAPRHQLYLESVGIVIPPQVEFSINYTAFSVTTGAPFVFSALVNPRIGAYIFGTKVNLNFNTAL